MAKKVLKAIAELTYATNNKQTRMCMCRCTYVCLCRHTNLDSVINISLATLFLYVPFSCTCRRVECKISVFFFFFSGNVQRVYSYAMLLSWIVSEDIADRVIGALERIVFLYAYVWLCYAVCWCVGKHFYFPIFMEPAMRRANMRPQHIFRWLHRPNAFVPFGRWW